MIDGPEYVEMKAREERERRMDSSYSGLSLCDVPGEWSLLLQPYRLSLFIMLWIDSLLTCY